MFTDGELNVMQDGLREGYIGGDLYVAETLGLQPRDSLSVHPIIPRFIEAEWGRLTGEERPFGSRVLAVADAYDALTSDRPYRSRLEVETALAVLRSGAGGQWEPELVEALVRVVERLPASHGQNHSR